MPWQLAGQVLGVEETSRQPVRHHGLEARQLGRQGALSKAGEHEGGVQQAVVANSRAAAGTHGVEDTSKAGILAEGITLGGLLGSEESGHLCKCLSTLQDKQGPAAGADLRAWGRGDRREPGSEEGQASGNRISGETNIIITC